MRLDVLLLLLLNFYPHDGGKGCGGDGTRQRGELGEFGRSGGRPMHGWRGRSGLRQLLPGSGVTTGGLLHYTYMTCQGASLQRALPSSLRLCPGTPNKLRTIFARSSAGI